MVAPRPVLIPVKSTTAKPKAPIYVSAPGAIRGKAPVVTKAPAKTSTSTPAKNTALTNQLNSAKKQLAGLQNQLKGLTGASSGSQPSSVTPVAAAPTEDAGLKYQKAMDEKARQDAFQELRTVFESYGMGSLADTITRMMKSGLTANAALVKLKYDKTIDPKTGKAWNAAYELRFAGNQKRIANGLNAMSEAEYRLLEDSYAETLTRYGLGNMMSVDRVKNEAMWATYIGNDIKAPEFKDRIATVEDRVINADANTKAMFKQWYPNLTDSDLIAYFLNPKETIGKLQEKATAAEIGAAAMGQGLGTSQTSAEDLAKYGIDRAGALAGYSNIADVLPISQQLSNIYKETGINYTQASGESEFLKSNAKAAEDRKRLKSLERGKFSGDSGVSSQAGSLNKAIQY